jgi:hypothetical protein
LEQIIEYRDKIDSAAPAWLVIFDRRPQTKDLPWDERISWEIDAETQVTILGC